MTKKEAKANEKVGCVTIGEIGGVGGREVSRSTAKGKEGGFQRWWEKKSLQRMCWIALFHWVAVRVSDFT